MEILWAVEYTYNRPGKPKDGETIYKHQLEFGLLQEGDVAQTREQSLAAAAEAADGAGSGPDLQSEMMVDGEEE